MKNVLGLGNALVDIMTQLENDATLAEFNLPKGSMQLVDDAAVNLIGESTDRLKKQLAAGGSAANTINGLAKMGIPSGFIGTVGDDEFGRFFENDMRESGINPMLLKGENLSGRAMALVSPDGERTFATFLGAAIELSHHHLEENHFDGYAYFHIEGYLVQNHELIRKAVELAKAKNLKVSLDMASFNVVEDNLEFLTDLVKNYVDIVFANEEEAKAFTGKEPEAALDAIAQMCEIAVVKIGSKGSLIKYKGEVTRVGVIQAECKDTTGAGDLYASGFLYGLIHDLPLADCGKIGSVLSGNVIEVIGAKMPEDRWGSIKKMVSEIH